MNHLYASLVFAFVTTVCQQSGSWTGHFKALSGSDNGIRHETIIDISCPDGVTCTARTSTYINGQEKEEEAVYSGNNVLLKNDGPFEIDKLTTERVKRSVKDMAPIADLPHAPAYYNSAIYREIGSPDHVRECRARAEDALVICRLHRPRVSDDVGRRTAWFLILPDYSSGAGCPGFGCPAALTREDPAPSKQFAK